MSFRSSVALGSLDVRVAARAVSSCQVSDLTPTNGVGNHRGLPLRVLGAYDAPLQAYTVTVQQDAAGVRGVPEILLSFPQEWGVEGPNGDTDGGLHSIHWDMDSRLRGNDKGGSTSSLTAAVWPCLSLTASSASEPGGTD